MSTSPPEAGPRDLVRALLLAVVIGVPVSLAALAFMALVSGATHLLWTTVPEQLGMASSPDWWYLVLVPTLGGLAVAVARRVMTGHAEHGPLQGFAGDTDPRWLPGILTAAFLTLSAGAVLGPEAPLLALGTGLGLLAARRMAEPVRKMSSAAGGFAAFSALLGNPLVTAIFLLEATSAKVASVALIPGLAASGVGFLVYTGVGSVTGFEMPSFTVPGLPEYTDILWTDLAWAIPVAVVAAVVATGAQVGGRVVETAGRRWPLTLTVPLGGLVVGVLAALWVAVSGQSYDTLLFSGEDAIPAVVAESSAGALLLLVLLKGVAYAVSLGCGFRGGPVFPALFLGVGVGVLASLVLPDFGITPAVAAALSAAAAAAVRLPFAAAALSLLLVGTAGAATTTLTILGSVVGFLVAMAVTRVAAARVAAASSPGDDQATA